MFHNLQVYGEQSWLQGRAKGVAVHEANLSVDGLMPQEVLSRRYHVLQNVFVRCHNFGHGLLGYLRQDLQRVHGLLSDKAVRAGDLSHQFVDDV